MQRITHKKNQIKEHETNVIDLPAAQATMKSAVQVCMCVYGWKRDCVREIERECAHV